MTKYLGPARTFNGQPVPADGLDVKLTDNQQLFMESVGHRFEPSMEARTRPTPAAVNAAVNPDTGEADLVAAQKAAEKAAKDKAQDK